MFLCVLLLITCNDNDILMDSKGEISLNTDMHVIEHSSIDSLGLDCKMIASEFYTLHDVKVSEFYQITQELGCDFNEDGYADSIYLLTPINQLLDKSQCYETVNYDTIILLIFSNNIGKQNLVKVYKNLFCPLSPNLIYRELVFDNQVFILKKDFGFGNGRKVYSDLYFSWKKEDFYADSVVISTFRNGDKEVYKEKFHNTKLSKLKNIDCNYF